MFCKCFLRIFENGVWLASLSALYFGGQKSGIFYGFVSCCFSGGPKRRKIQGIYFEISALYFKIYGLYFLQQAMCFFACPQTREKTRGSVGALSVNT